MEPSNPANPAPKRPRRPAAKPDGPTANVALQLKLAPRIKQRLEVESLGRGCTVSALVTELVEAMPAQYVLSRRGQGGSIEPKPLALADAG